MKVILFRGGVFLGQFLVVLLLLHHQRSFKAAAFLLLLLHHHSSVAFFVDDLPNLQDVFRPRFFAVVKLVQQGEILLEHRGVRLHLVHHAIDAIDLLFILVVLCVLEVQGEIVVELEVDRGV